MKTWPVSDDDGNGTPWKRWVEREGNQSPRWGRLVFSISPYMTCPLKIKAKETGEANGKRRSVLSLGHDELQPSAAALLRWHVDCPWFSRLLLGVGRDSDGSPAYIQRRPQAQLTFSRLNVTEIKTHLSVLFSSALCRPCFHYCVVHVILSSGLILRLPAVFDSRYMLVMNSSLEGVCNILVQQNFMSYAYQVKAV